MTYLDENARARKAFADPGRPLSLLRAHRRYTAEPAIAFVPGDSTRTLAELLAGRWDLAISLYAGPISEHVARCLRPGGWLLVNRSHADAGLAHLNARFELAAAVHHRSGTYRLSTDDLDHYFQPARPPHPTREELLADGRGARYLRPADAYLFRLSGPTGR
ncbi:hypothetical protein [Nocardia rhizosphaerae]|uniref:Uncharacterized protein n=1 Tax=Nocardia rhizosphaerae TaxID=1691571 RepID=A0ABV8LAW3_9NOCA